MTKENAIKVAEWWNERQKGLKYANKAEVNEYGENNWTVDVIYTEKWLGTVDMRYLMTIADYYIASTIVHVIGGELKVRIY